MAQRAIAAGAVCRGLFTLGIGLARLRSIGVTHFNAQLLEVDVGSRERSRDYLQSRI
jgi:hypothetical protein